MVEYLKDRNSVLSYSFFSCKQFFLIFWYYSSNFNISVLTILSKMLSIQRKILMLFLLAREISSYFNQRHLSMTLLSTFTLSKCYCRILTCGWMLSSASTWSCSLIFFFRCNVHCMSQVLSSLVSMYHCWRFLVVVTAVWSVGLVLLAKMPILCA